MIGYESIEARVLRLRVLIIDAHHTTDNARPITKQETADLAAILDELHRLHKVVAAEVREKKQIRERLRKTKATRSRRTAQRQHPRPAAPPLRRKK